MKNFEIQLKSSTKFIILFDSKKIWMRTAYFYIHYQKLACKIKKFAVHILHLFVKNNQLNNVYNNQF